MAVALLNKEVVYNALEKVISTEDFVRVIYYLDLVEQQGGASGHGIWNSLIFLATKKEKSFTLYANRLAEDTKTAEKNPGFYKVISEMYEEMLTPSDAKWNPKLRFAPLSKTQVGSWLASFAWAMGKLSPDVQIKIMTEIPRIVGESSQVALYAESSFGMVKKLGGKVTMCALATIFLAYDVIKNIKLLWKGEIGPRRCAANCINATFAVSFGCGGSVVGAWLGSFLGPIGTLVGGLIGGAISSNVAEMLADLLTRKLFDLPKDVMTERAYDYLGVKASSSSAEINSAFRKMCLLHHPDKPWGNIGRFHELQYQMAIIKVDRGDL